MAELPCCPDPKCHRPMQFLAEEHDTYIFVCNNPPVHPVYTTRLITKPAIREAQRYAVERQRLATSQGKPSPKAFSFSTPRS